MTSVPWLLSLGEDTLKLWDYRNLATVSTHKCPTSVTSMQAVSWSSKADCIAVTGQSRDKSFSIFLLDIGKKGLVGSSFVDIFNEVPRTPKSSNPSNTFTITKASRVLATFSNAGSNLACARSDGQVDIYSRKSNSVLKTLPSTASSRQISAMIFCVDDTILLAGDDQGKVEIWTWAGTEDSPRFTIDTKLKAVTQLYQVPFNQTLVVSTHASGSVAVLDIQNGELVHTFNLAHLDACRGFAFSPVNSFTAVSVGTDNRLVVYDMKDRKKLTEIVADNSLTAVAFFPNGREVACGTSSGKILVFDLSKGSAVQRSIAAHTSTVLSLSFPPETNRREKNVHDRASIASTPQSPGLSENSHHKKLSLNVEGKGIANGSTSEPPSAAGPSSEGAKIKLGRTVSLPKSKDTFRLPPQSSIKPNHPPPSSLATATTVKSRSGAVTESGQGDASTKMPPPNFIPALQLNGSSDGVSLDSSAGADKPEEAAAQSPEQFWSEKRVADLTKVLRDDIVLENRISCLDVHDVIHAYCSETTDRVWDVLDKVDLLRNEVRENRAILQLILQKLSSLERNVLY